MNKLKISIKKIWNPELLYVLLVGLLYLAWAMHLKMDWAPDEYMRKDIALFIYNHGYLPQGDEEEIINYIWGTSYGFTPYLPSIIAAFFMKIMGVFHKSDVALLLAQRMVSILAGMGTAFFALKTGKRLFSNTISKYIFTSIICLLPQFVFLSSYFNNDVFAVFSCMIIFYFWIAGMQDGWNLKRSIGLGIGIGFCVMSYYNAYGFVLASIFVFFISFLKKENTLKKKKIWKLAFVVFAVAFAIGGWFFIRNAVIHDGDFLGMRSSGITSELYAQHDYKPSNRSTLLNQGGKITDILLDGKWIPTMFLSFVGDFGYMTAPIDKVVLCLYLLILGVGLYLGIYTVFTKKRNRWFAVIVLFTMLLPWGLILYSSYTTDYQCQGRYVITMLIGLAYFSTIGFEEKVSGKSSYEKDRTLRGILTAWIILLIITYVTTIFPGVWTSGVSSILN